jgi:alkylated DNA repair dioxygenase AlkB
MYILNASAKFFVSLYFPYFFGLLDRRIKYRMKRKQQDLTSYFNTHKKQKKKEPDIQYHPNWLQSMNVISDCIPLIYENIEWYKVSYFKPGINKTITTPRYTTVYGSDEGPSQLQQFPIEPIPEYLKPLLAAVEKTTGSHFNMIMCNLYLDPSHSISWHSDDEHFLGPNPCIASLTIGGSREFFLREKADHKNKVKFTLANGDLLVMKGRTQHDWDHSIPKRTNQAMKPRINLTFRRVIDYRGTNNYYKYTKFGDAKPHTVIKYHYDYKKHQMIQIE